MEEENEEHTVSMVDVLNEEDELEADANAVLGGSDDNDCTYPRGYVKRQALYSCSTCFDKSNIKSGVCLACSLACHEGHELFELYTKRHFRCDCGNSKFKDFKCQLYQQEKETNEKNKYNQNFDGLYCSCHRPYPDPEDQVSDEMIQCIVCEDWFHGRHLGIPVPSDFDEMICGECVNAHPFLWNYYDKKKFGEKVTSTPETETVQVDKEAEKDTNGSASSEPKPSECTLPTSASPYKGQHAAFWTKGWRKSLCSCADCMKLYKEEHMEYLVDENDTVSAYEAAGRAKVSNKPLFDDGMDRFMNQMNRTQQIELAHGYNDLKVALTDFLKGFAERKRVVRKEDIDEFFGAFQAKRRRESP